MIPPKKLFVGLFWFVQIARSRKVCTQITYAIIITLLNFGVNGLTVKKVALFNQKEVEKNGRFLYTLAKTWIQMIQVWVKEVQMWFQITGQKTN